jgi:mannosyltransferase
MNDDIWDDEAFSWWAAHLSWDDLWTLTTHRDPHTALWHLIEKGWLELHDGGPVYLRLLPLIFAIASAALVYVLGRRLWSHRVGLIAAAAMILHPSVEVYAAEARPYTLVMFLTTLAVWVIAEAWCRAWGPRGYFLAGLVGGLAAYAHPFAALALMSVIAVLVLHPKGSGFSYRSAALSGGFIMTLLPLMILMSEQAGGSNLDWVGPLGVGAIRAALDFLGGYAVLAIAAGGFILWAALKLRDLRWAILAGWLIGLPTLLVLISLAKPVLVDRYVAPAVPAFALILGAALEWVYTQHRRLVPVAALSILVLGFALTSRVADADKAEWSDAVNYIAIHAEPGDGVMVRGHRPVFDYYLRWNPGAEAELVPLDADLPWGQPVYLYESSPELDRPAEVSAALAGVTRVWIANLESQREGRTGMVTDALAAEGFHRADSQTFDPKVFVERWER